MYEPRYLQSDGGYRLKVRDRVDELVEAVSIKGSVVRIGLLPAVGLSTVAVSTTLAEKIAIVGSLALLSAALAMWARKREVKEGG